MALSNSGTRNKDVKETVTFEEAMDIVGTGYFQIKLAIIGGIVILSSYFAIGAVTFPLPGAACDLNIDYEERGTLASISFIGLIITCHMWGFLSDTLGRRYILLRCLICDALLYILTMLSANFYVILFLRLLNGVASCGGVVSIYAYISEFQTNKFRSRALMISCFIATSSYVLLPAMAWLIIPIKWQFDLYPGLTIKSWRLYYIACGIPSLMSTILLYFLPESPKFLLAKRENDKVITILRKMYIINHKNCDGFTIKNIKMIEDEKIGKLDDNKNKVLAVCQLVWNQTAPLLKKPYRCNFIMLSVALFICFFCNNAMYVWLPEAINRMELYKNVTGQDSGSFCEVLDVDKFVDKIVSTKPVFNNSQITTGVISRKLLNAEEPVCNDDIDTSVYLVYIIFGLVEMAVWIVLTSIIKYINKKYLIFFLMTCTLISTISMKLSNILILMPIKACAIIVFTAGVFPILNSVVVDLFPTNLRAMAGCLTLMASRIGTVVTHEVTGFLIKSHCHILTWNYIILTGVCLVLLLFLPFSPPQQSSSSTKNDQEKHSNEQV